MIVLRFRDDPDPVRFQYIHGAVITNAPLQYELKALIVQRSLVLKLEAVSEPDPRAEPFYMSVPRIMLKPADIELTEDECALLLHYLQKTPWKPAAVPIVGDVFAFVLNAVSLEREDARVHARPDVGDGGRESDLVS